MVELQDDDAADRVRIGRDHPDWRGLAHVQREVSDWLRRRLGPELFGVQLGAPWRADDPLERKDDVLAAFRAGVQAGPVGKAGVAVAEEPNPKLARVDRLLDVTQQGVRRVETPVQPVATGRQPELALVQELMRNADDHHSAD